MQSLGDCAVGERCHRAHGTEDLDISTSKLDLGQPMGIILGYIAVGFVIVTPDLPKAFCLLQELGDCAVGERCHWAHGTDDLDTGAFKFDFPAVNGNLEGNDWVSVGDSKKGNKLTSVRTGRQPTQTSGHHSKR